MTNAMVAAGSAVASITPYQVKQQVQQIQHLMSEVMQDNSHYGTIPGCGNRPTLLQPGAQKLCLMFGLADDYQIEQTDMPNGHREYRVKCTLTHKGNGIVQGSGYGICSTMESKYRYRNAADYEVLDDPIPADYQQRKQEYRKQGYGSKKVNGVWCWVRFTDSSKQENPDIADTYNTVLKMACKRALVHATLNTTAASDIFTQDLEDDPTAGQMDQSSAATPNQPQPAPQSEFDKYRAALKRAKDERGVPIKDAMDEVAKEIAKPTDEYTVEDLARAVEIVDSMEAAPLEPNDIEF